MTKEQTRIALPYGDDLLQLELPSDNLLAVLEPNEAGPHPEVATQIREAMKKPIGTPPFATLMDGVENLLILVDDVTRPTPVDEILPVFLTELGVQPGKIKVTILIALGTHRPMTPQEIENKVGRDILDTYPVLNHEWDNKAALVDLRPTRNGTPVRVNRLVEEADLCIGIGNIVPHNLAGWSGGGKILQPGVCGPETTYATHLLAARCPSTNLGKARNPVRAEIAEVVNRTSLKAVLNTVLDQDGDVAHVVAGQPQVAYEEGVELARAIWEVSFPSLADIVITSSYPADIDFWQANKGLYASERVVKRGGDIILVTPCPEGVSTQEEHVETVEALARLPSRQQYHEAQKRGIEDYAALCVSDIAARCRELAWVTVVSDGLSDDQIARLGMDPADSVAEALERALDRQGEDATIMVLTHGGETLPSLQSQGS
jgi:nickel-dependent lactate racemase